MSENVQTSGGQVDRQVRPTALSFGEAELKALYAKLGVTAHPILTLPTVGQAQMLMATEAGRQSFLARLQSRQERIRLAAVDPLNWTFEAETWADADRVLLDSEDHILAIFGGNRAQKTWYAVKRVLEVALIFPGSKLAICSEALDASIATVQALAWYYIRPHFEHLNQKRDAVYAIGYSQKNGFADGKLIFPNGSEVHFLTYNQEAGNYEGWMFGAPMDVYKEVSAKLTEALADPSGESDYRLLPHLFRNMGDTKLPIIDLKAWRAMGRKAIPNIGADADESMPMSWLKMFDRRVKFLHAKLLWTFTPVKGITPAIKEAVGASAKTIESRPSELLPGQNFPDLPKGHMPYIRQGVMKGAKAMYFFSCYNKFGPGQGLTYYDAIKALCDGKTTEYIERVAYGYARDSIARAYPAFSALNVVKRSEIPANGTNYFFFDPHGTRNFPMIWVRAVPTRPVSWYIYREWPDVPTYGEWAVPTEREVNEQNRKGWDGDQGPAQTGLGWGVERYKQEILRLEKIVVPAKLNDEGRMMNDEVERIVATAVVDAYHRRRILQAWRNGEALAELREEIVARYGDPRGIHNEHVSEKGGTTLYDLFESEQLDGSGRVIAPAMELWDAPTSRRSNVEEADEGITLVNGLLGSPQNAMPGVNQPRLFVCNECHNVIWMLENYTGRGGASGAAKDFSDLVKYACLAELEHVEAGVRRGKPGKGF